MYKDDKKLINKFDATQKAIAYTMSDTVVPYSNRFS